VASGLSKGWEKHTTSPSRSTSTGDLGGLGDDDAEGVRPSPDETGPPCRHNAGSPRTAPLPKQRVQNTSRLNEARIPLLLLSDNDSDSTLVSCRH
jgi:hypothetical protein